MNYEKQKIIERLISINVMKKGDFILKSGKRSGYYFDMRKCISKPDIICQISKYINKVLIDRYNRNINEYDYICGVAYGGLPYSNVLSFKYNISQIYVRDKVKEYGTKSRIEGLLEKSDKGKVLLIEDVITTGNSVIEIAEILKEDGYLVDILCILDRREEKIDKILGYNIYIILEEDDFEKKYLENSINIKEINNKIYEITYEKKSNIIFSADLESIEEIKDIVEEIHMYIVGIKLHSDIIEGINEEIIRKWKEEYNLVIIEDMKLGDIGSISLLKIKRIIRYADYITYHPIIGEKFIEMVREEYPSLGLIGVVEMSIEDSITKKDYYIDDMLNKINLMNGCVIQKKGLERLKLKKNKEKIITLSPGISLEKYNKDNTTHNNLEKIGKNELGEYWIIGRGIYKSKKIKVEIAREYREIGWKYYLEYDL